MKKTVLISLIVALCSVAYTKDIHIDFLEHDLIINLYDTILPVILVGQDSIHYNNEDINYSIESSYTDSTGVKFPVEIDFLFQHGDHYLTKTKITFTSDITEDEYKRLSSELLYRTGDVFRIKDGSDYSYINPEKSYELVETKKSEYKIYTKLNNAIYRIDGNNDKEKLALSFHIYAQIPSFYF